MKKPLAFLSIGSLLLLTGCNKPLPVNKYTISFVNYDGQVLQTTQVDEGTLPVYEGKTPQKDAPDKKHQNVYIGWDKEITKATEDATYVAQFDYVFLFGNYPQKLVSDPELSEAIKNYGTVGPLDYITYNSKNYYSFTSLQNFTADDGTKVKKDETNYYEVLPIQWKILGDESKQFYTTYRLLDVGIFNNVIVPNPYYSNNYANSYMDAWMNNTTKDGFLGRAFTVDEQKQIPSHEIDNSLESTMDEDSKYVCDPTNEQIFALSRKELRDPNLGFDDKDKVVSNRLSLTTDLARAKGAASIKNYGLYWSRSPSSNDFVDNDASVYDVTIDGAITYAWVDYQGRCFRPAINLSKTEK